MSKRQPWMHDLITTLAAPTVVLSAADGQIRPSGAQGVLHAGTRVLSQAVLRADRSGTDGDEADRSEPVAVGGQLHCADVYTTECLLPTLGDPGPDPTVRLRRRRTVRPGAVEELISVVSRAHTPVTARIVLEVAADFARIEEIKSGHDRPPVRPVVAGETLRWTDGTVEARLTATGATLDVTDSGSAALTWQLDLPAGGTQDLRWQLTAWRDASPLVAAIPDPRWASIDVPAADPRLEPALRQAIADLAALRMAPADAPSDTFLAAGAPWFFTLFGRDSLWAARLLLPLGEPGTGVGAELAAGTLRVLAARQGTSVRVDTGEEPGKIPHELRHPDGLYYGTVDATPLWICLLYDAWRAGMPDDQVRPLIPHLVAALGWMADYGDADDDGFLEYVDKSGRGLANQGWKDSGDAIRFADGRYADPPVALCEVQGYAYEAATHGAELLDAFGEPGAEDWRRWATRLAGQFREQFWVADDAGAYPALALDAAKRPVDAVTSNIGHLLGSGILNPAETALVAARVTAPELDSGFGLRTMSTRAAGFWPLSYHCGSVWPHDTAIVIRGLVSTGYAELARGLIDGLVSAAVHFDNRPPELYAGDARTDVPFPAPYPAACRPQAWSAAALVAIALAGHG